MEQNEAPEMNPYIYGKLIFDKGAQALIEERRVFSTNDPGTTGQPHAKDKVRLFSYTIYKN